MPLPVSPFCQEGGAKGTNYLLLTVDGKLHTQSLSNQLAQASIKHCSTSEDISFREAYPPYHAGDTSGYCFVQGQGNGTTLLWISRVPSRSCP